MEAKKFIVVSKSWGDSIFESDSESHVKAFVKARIAAYSTARNVSMKEAEEAVMADLEFFSLQGHMA